MNARHYRNLIRAYSRNDCIGRNAFETYIHGYETAAGKDCNFVELLNRQMQKWRDHFSPNWLFCFKLDALAEKLSLDWHSLHHIIASEVLRHYIQPASKRTKSRAKTRNSELMTPAHISHWLAFNTRMSMYIAPRNKETITSYIVGYGQGAKYAGGTECRFEHAISQLIAEKYGIKRGGNGWPYQIQDLANTFSLDWIDAYYLISF